DTGDEIPSSTILAGEDADPANPAGTCNSTKLVLNALHEQCTRTIDPTDANAILSAGGWWDILVEDAAGAGTCTSADSAVMWLVVEFQ
ncbi:unnamed protein product, partial [marine sediment metagenome]